MMMRGLLLLASVGFAAAENGLNGWLRYAPLTNAHHYYDDLPSCIAILNNTHGSPIYASGIELEKGLQGIFGKEVEICPKKSKSAVVVGTVDQYTKTYGKLN